MNLSAGVSAILSPAVTELEPFGFSAHDKLTGGEPNGLNEHSNVCNKFNS